MHAMSYSSLMNKLKKIRKEYKKIKFFIEKYD